MTDAPRLAAIYDTILSARFDQADHQLTTACPPAPAGACKALGAVSMWWQILLDPDSRRLDAAFNARVTAAITANEAWTTREPTRAEAWFYLAGSYAPLVQWRVLRGERLAAARNGKTIKDALETALRLDPTLNDAYFGIGLYHYYADVAPTVAKILRWLLFLPGGDRVKGLQEMLQAHDRGELLRGEADYQLHLLYLWYERQPERALTLVKALDARYGSNPLFLERVAEIEDEYVHDRPASAGAWQMLLDRARAGRTGAARVAEVRARIGLAAQLDAMYETDRAIEQLNAVVAMNPSEPHGALAQAHLQLGAGYDRLGERDRAVAHYTRAVALAPAPDPLAIRDRARARLRSAPDRRATDAYRLTIDGWRTLERGEVNAAHRLLARAVALAPTDAVARYRYAAALGRAGDTTRQREELERLIASRTAPAFVLASAYVDCAALLERAGDRARALTFYRLASNLVGGDPRARDQATRAVARLSSVAGSKRNFF